MKYDEFLSEQERLATARNARPSTDTEQPSHIGSDDADWESVVRTLQTHYYEPDILAARALYASVAAHCLKGQPVWPMAVAPPSSMKTEIVQALDGLKNVFSIDAVTPKTFISGQIREEDDKPDLPPSSLLHRIGNSGIIICADFSTILAIKSDDRNAIFADLRRIYDGDLKKEFGTADRVEGWKGRITFVACVTPEIDTKYRAIQSLGDRFLMMRWGRAGQQAALQAMVQDSERARAELKHAVHGLLNGLPQVEPDATPFLKRLASLADFVARARSHVPRESDGDKAIIGEPEPESAPRLAQQLCQLAKGSALLSHRSSLAEEDFAVARRAGFDCIPAARRKALEWALNGGRVSKTSSSQKYLAEDLEAVGLLADGRLSRLATDLYARIERKDDFTDSPPSANKEQNAGVGGTSREAETIRGQQ